MVTLTWMCCICHHCLLQALLDNDFDYSSEEENGSGVRSMARIRRSSMHR